MSPGGDVPKARPSPTSETSAAQAVRRVAAALRSAAPDLHRLTDLLYREVPTATHAAVYGRGGGPESADFALLAFAGEPPLDRVVQAGNGLLGYVAQTGQAIDVADAEADARTLVCYLEARSELVIPIVGEGRILGLLHLQRAELGPWGDAALAAAQELADWLAARWPGCDGPASARSG